MKYIWKPFPPSNNFIIEQLLPDWHLPRFFVIHTWTPSFSDCKLTLNDLVSQVHEAQATHRQIHVKDSFILPFQGSFQTVQSSQGMVADACCFCSRQNTLNMLSTWSQNYREHDLVTFDWAPLWFGTYTQCTRVSYLREMELLHQVHVELHM